MWELIQANRRKSFLVFTGMAAFLVGLGFVVGFAFEPNGGGYYGIVAALVIWFFLALISLAAGDSILLASSRAHEVTRDIHPQLFNVVEEIKIAANLPSMPKIYIMDELQPNAFAAGKDIRHSSIAVTAGLLSKLNRDELQGVIAHEMSHVTNRDVFFMTAAGVLLGSITLISEIFLRGTYYGGTFSTRRFRSSARGGAYAQAAGIMLAVLVAVLAPILAQLFYFALSRKREYLADACGVRLTRYPEGLASALQKISKSNHINESFNSITAPMYIASPLRGESGFSSLFSTHPPIDERIQILRNMSQGAGFANYQRAYASVKGRPESVIPASGLSEKEEVPVRSASVPAESTKAEEQMRQTHGLGDLIRATNRFIFLACSCGLRFKIPPDYKKESMVCPRCFSEVRIPKLSSAETRASDQTGEAMLSYERKGNSWESFYCSCGRLMQLSPLFSGQTMECASCHRTIEIRSLQPAS